MSLQPEARCGTPSGAGRHRRLGEPVCAECLAGAARTRQHYRLRNAYPPPVDPEAAMVTTDEPWATPVPDRWTEHAICKDHPGEWWFPDGIELSGARRRALPPDGRAAVALCNTCPVQRDCLEYAVRVGVEDGIWGGRTPVEIDRLRRATRRSIA